MSHQWKRWIWTLMLCVGAVPAFSQTLELGTVTVSLGMAKQQVLRLFSEASYKVMESTATSSATVIDGALKHVYTVQFTGSRLTYADRSWTSTDGEGLDAAIKALGALAQKGAASCSVAHAPVSEPDTTLDRVFVKCGQRGVLMIRGKASGIGDTYDVSEFIGAFN